MIIYVQKVVSNFRRILNIHKWRSLLGHVHNLKNNYGLPVVVGINGFSFDTEKEKDLLKAKSKELNVPIVSSTHWADGGAGAKELAETVVKTINESENNFDFLYPDDMPLWDKMETIAKKIYGASSISAPANIKKQIDDLTIIVKSGILDLVTNNKLFGIVHNVNALYFFL